MILVSEGSHGMEGENKAAIVTSRDIYKFEFNKKPRLWRPG